MCGNTFVFKIVLFFYPLYWIYGGIKLLTALMLLGTVILYFRYLPIILKNPDKVVEFLTEHLDLWTKEVSSHMDTLRGEHTELATNLIEQGLPTTTLETNIHATHDTDEANKRQMLESLDKIKKNLQLLAEKVHRT
jgi:hypothetical protein